jgi:hypothetical protein
LTFREDDASFKRRLNTTIQISWVYNTVLVVLVCLGIFFIIDYSLAYGLVLGILLAMISNIHITLNQVTHASRWEIYKNRFIMPWGIRGHERLLMFEDIKTIERQRGMVTDRIIVQLVSGEVLRIDASGLQKPTEALEMAFRRFVRVRSERLGKISIPVAGNGEQPTSTGNPGD